MTRGETPPSVRPACVLPLRALGPLLMLATGAACADDPSLQAADYASADYPGLRTVECISDSCVVEVVHDLNAAAEFPAVLEHVPRGARFQVFVRSGLGWVVSLALDGESTDGETSPMRGRVKRISKFAQDVNWMVVEGLHFPPNCMSGQLPPDTAGFCRDHSRPDWTINCQRPDGCPIYEVENDLSGQLTEDDQMLIPSESGLTPARAECGEARNIFVTDSSPEIGKHVISYPMYDEVWDFNLTSYSFALEDAPHVADGIVRSGHVQAVPTGEWSSQPMPAAAAAAYCDRTCPGVCESDCDFGTADELMAIFNDPLYLVDLDEDHRVPTNYEQWDLVDINSDGVTRSTRGQKLRPAAADAFRRMYDHASSDGYTLRISGEGYRPYGLQCQWYYVGSETITPGDAARPGHSEHQLGLAVDITTRNYYGEGEDDWFSTAVWLNAHATDYGFVRTYPTGYKGCTGFDEPWHWRYVGPDAARDIASSGRIMIEYLRDQDCP